MATCVPVLVHNIMMETTVVLTVSISNIYFTSRCVPVSQPHHMIIEVRNFTELKFLEKFIATSFNISYPSFQIFSNNSTKVRVNPYDCTVGTPVITVLK